MAHTSDLHLEYDDGTQALEAVIQASENAGAQFLLLAGDVFENNRVSLRLLESVVRLIGDSSLETVILPGNHDCLGLDSVYRRGGIADPDNVHVLGVTCDDLLDLPQHELSIWGRAHAEYRDMSPLQDPAGRLQRRHIAMAHGHWVTNADDLHRSWLIRDDEIAAVDADYVALGHWDRAVRLTSPGAQAYYSGSPHLARSINIVDLDDSGTAVWRLSLSDRSSAESG